MPGKPAAGKGHKAFLTGHSKDLEFYSKSKVKTLEFDKIHTFKKVPLTIVWRADWKGH